MKTIEQVLEMISNEKQVVIAVRGDNHEYEYLDYTKNSMHFLNDCRDFESNDNVPNAKELDGKCAFMVWEYGQDVEIEKIAEKLNRIAEYAKGYGQNVHIIACEVNAYEYGWDETECGQEIIMKEAWVISKM
jgi:hypothetical protein